MTTDLQSDRLVTAAQAGDLRALEELLGLHRERVYRYGLRHCRTTEDAEDAVQETLFAASRALGTFRRGAAITTWLFTIVRHSCHRKNARRRDEAELGDEHPSAGPTAEDEAASAEVRRALAAALSRLEPTHREVILLRDVEGLTAPEAARELGIGVDALKSRLHRARQALRSALGAAKLAAA